MARSLTASVLTEFQANSLKPIVFYEGEFVSGTVRLWSGLRPIDWNGVTWAGAGTLIGISPIKESVDVRAEGIICSLAGVSTDAISLVLQECRYGKSGKVWIGALDVSDQVIVDPYLAFVGKLDVPSIDDEGEVCKVSISYESRLMDLQRAKVRRWNHEDQKLDYPGDLGFAFVTALQQKNIVWGT